MQYASLAEAFGDDFAQQVSTQHPLYSVRNDQLPTTQKVAQKRAIKDRTNSRESFYDESVPSSLAPRWKHSQKNHINAWGDEENQESGDELDDVRPRAEKNKFTNYNPVPTLLSEKPSSTDVDFSGVGYGGPDMSLGTLEESNCRNYFYHLDRCQKCQQRLKKRVVRYLRALQSSGSAKALLPGARGANLPDQELFLDRPEDSVVNTQHEEKMIIKEKEEQPKQQLKENFTNQDDSILPALFLMAFGILILFVLDQSRKSSSFTKIIKI